jgi:hypothetical protein
VNVLAAIRTHDVDLALFVHVLGAMILFGGLVTAAGAGLLGWRDESPRLRRFAAMSLVLAAFPGWIVMRIGAEWTYSKEHLGSLSKDPSWLGIGFITADGGGLLLLIALITGGIGYARKRDALLRTSTVIAALLVAVYVIAIWAMGGKPS